MLPPPVQSKKAKARAKPAGLKLGLSLDIDQINKEHEEKQQ